MRGTTRAWQGAQMVTANCLAFRLRRTVFPRFLGVSVILGILLGILLTCVGQSKSKPASTPIDPATGQREARALVAEMLAQVPEENGTNFGTLTIRRHGSKAQIVRARFETVITPTNWLNIYETDPSPNGAGTMKLTVVHHQDGPNQYMLGEIDGSGPMKTVELTGNGAQIPFAGSDFWLADLGLEFLHWPEQRLLMREMRKGQACEVLESINPQPAPGGYARVRSWLESESPHGIVHADAYDTAGDLLKEFDPKKLKKIHGSYELEEMEIRNEKTAGRTLIEFNLKPDGR
jgi:hypothetical protein